MGSLVHGTSVDKKQDTSESVIHRLNELEMNWYDEMERIRNKEYKGINEKNEKKVRHMEGDTEYDCAGRKEDQNGDKQYDIDEQDQRKRNNSIQNNKTQLGSENQNRKKQDNKMKMLNDGISEQISLAKHGVQDLELDKHTTHLEKDTQYTEQKEEMNILGGNTVKQYELKGNNSNNRPELQQTIIQNKEQQSMKEIGDSKQKGKGYQVKIKRNDSNYRSELQQTEIQNKEQQSMREIGNSKQKENDDAETNKLGVNIYSKIFSQYQKEQDEGKEGISQEENEMNDNTDRKIDIIQWLQDIKINRKIEYKIEQLDGKENEESCSTLDKISKESTSIHSEYEEET